LKKEKQINCAKFKKTEIMKLNQLLFGSVMLFAPFVAGAYTSLTVNDPHNCCFSQQAAIEEATLMIDAQKEYINYELEMTISAGVLKAEAAVGHDSVEVVCNFDMPAGAFISSAALLIDGEWVDAELMARKEAHAIYEGIVQRRRDPLIIYKNYGDNYQFKIYPLAIAESRSMKLRYALPAGSVDGNKSVVLPIDMLTASSKDVDLKVLVKDNGEFDAPQFNDEVSFSDSEQEGYKEAVLPAEALTDDLELSSDNKIGSPRFAADIDDDGEATYRFSFVPNELFELEESRNYLIMIDNAPETRTDTSWYYYSDSERYSERTKFYTIYPTKNDVLLKEVKKMLSNLNDNDQFNILIKNNGIYSYSDSWVKASKSNIESAVAAVAANDESYTSDLNGFLKAGIEWANQAQTSTILLSNSKEFIGQRLYEQSQAEASKATDGVVFDNGINVFDITAVRDNGENDRYYYNRFLGDVARKLGAYSRNVYYLSYLETNMQTILQNERSKLILLNVASSTDAGLIYDQADNAQTVVHPEDQYIQFGKTSGADVFSSVVSFKYKGERFQKRFDFSISDYNDDLIEKAWAVSIADKLNQQYTTESKLEAEAISMENSVLTQNTSFLALEPGVEYTKCETCPDWENWRFGNEVMLDGAVDFAVEDVAVPSLEYNGETGVDIDAVYNEAYAKGVKEAESDCQLNFDQAYGLGYDAGLQEASVTIDSEMDESDDLTVYPKPFTVSFTVELDEAKDYTVRLMDIIGSVVFEKECNGIKEFKAEGKELSDLPAGVYVLEVVSDGETQKTFITKE